MININSNSTVIVLAPHTDDGEFGCGASISKFTSLGARVIYVAFSAAEQSVLEHLPKDILRTEVKEATKVLGISEDDCIVLDFQVRIFAEFRQQILDKLIELNNKYQPDLVLLPSINDTHQDHQTIAKEGFRAFKRTTMLAYEIPWNNLEFKTVCFIEASEKNINKKIEAISMYESQKHRVYSSDKFLRSWAITRGVQIGKEYAETFDVVRWVIND